MRYITDLTVLEGKDAEPRSGWTKIDKDLNAGAGGSYLYFAYEEGDDPNRAIRHIAVVEKGQTLPDDYTKIDVDLNKGAGGDYLYAAFTRDSLHGDRGPITALDVVISDTDHLYDDPPWTLLNQYDLNRGAGGKYVYIRFQKPPGINPATLGIGVP